MIQIKKHKGVLSASTESELTSQAKTGFEWDDKKKNYVPKAAFELTHEEYNTSVTIEIDGNRGRVRPAKNMRPLIHSKGSNGRYDIQNLSVSRDMVRGEFKLNGANSPKITIDRRAGRIMFDGLTKFTGSCTPLDADRKF